MINSLKRLFGFAPPTLPELPAQRAWYNGIWGAAAVGEYPDWADLEWFACDRLGQLAFFTTAGQGAVPHAVFRLLSDYLAARDIFWHLPDRCGHTLHEAGREKPRPDDWVKLARRGLFGYDYDWGAVGTGFYCRSAILPRSSGGAPNQPLQQTAAKPAAAER